MSAYVQTDIGIFERDEGETIDQEGNWYLIRVPTYSNWESWIVHGCKKYLDGKVLCHRLGAYVYNLNPPCCIICGETPPERLQTLWILHNFDNIQKATR